VALTELIGDALKRLSKAATTFSLVAALAAVREREERLRARRRERGRRRLSKAMKSKT